MQLAAGGSEPRFDLTVSNPTRAGSDFSQDLLRVFVTAQSESSALAYRPEPFGARVARQAVVEWVAAARGLSSDHVMLTPSTSDAYSYLFKLLCDPGDAVLVPAPSYPLFEHLAELESVRVIPYRLAYDGAWHIDLDSLRLAIDPDVRAVVVVSPNNPTGQYLKSSELAAIESLGLPIISDEVFAEYPLQAAAPAYSSALSATGTLVFALGGLSKLAGLPQLKLAWTLIGGPEPQRREARERLELIADTFLSVSTPVQAALPAILRAHSATTAAMLARCRENASWLEQATRAAPLNPLDAEGGWNAVLRLPSVQSEEELVLGLLEHESVLVQPGWFYDFETEPFAIVSLLTEPPTFHAGIERLVDYVTRACR